MTTDAPTLTELPAEVSQARARHEAAQEAVAARLAAWEATLPDGPEAAQLEAEEAYRAAQHDEERARLVLKATEGRHAARVAQVEEAERLQRWAQVRNLCARRRELAVRLDMALDAVESVLEEWRGADQAIRSVHPAWTTDRAAGDAFVAQYLGHAISRRGWHGALWGREAAAGLPTLTEQVRRHERTLLYGAPPAGGEKSMLTPTKGRGAKAAVATVHEGRGARSVNNLARDQRPIS